MEFFNFKKLKVLKVRESLILFSYKKILDFTESIEIYLDFES